ncbi:MAG: hypothetical protein M1823_000442 [Watsoniomyces obsoletus]|nr:MAG: hypothetical protein M1823_000442 [Watsoniomyces obsoletus]
MADSPGSPLSSLASDDLINLEDLKAPEHESTMDPIADHASDTLTLPPSKRQKMSTSSRDRHASSPLNGLTHNDPQTDVSSDTSGDIPGSPGSLLMLPEDDFWIHEQVTKCRWEDCSAGDQGNMDSLVAHIHEEHIGSRQKRYACEWADCSRKGYPHASGYALKAHMRSHTREKPFYCALPECDRSFTRSDALAKHMRTVHETEALRPSDPVPKNHSGPPARPQRLKLIFSAKPPEERGPPEEDDEYSGVDEDPSAHPHHHHHHHHHHDNHDAPVMATPELDALAAAAARMQHAQETFPPELEFTDVEMAMPPQSLFRLLRRQLHWTEEEEVWAKGEIESLEKRHKGEWKLKEMMLENTLASELDRQDRRRRKRRKLHADNQNGNGDENGNGDAGVKDGDVERKPILLPKALPAYFSNGEEYVDGPVENIPEKKSPDPVTIPRFLFSEGEESGMNDGYLEPEDALSLL